MSERIRLNIGGNDYYITADDGKEYFEAIGRELDEKMTKMSCEKPYLSTPMVGVLTALGYADSYKRSLAEIERLNGQLRAAVDDTAAAELNLANARREIERLESENTRLRTKLSGR